MGDFWPARICIHIVYIKKKGYALFYVEGDASDLSWGRKEEKKKLLAVLIRHCCFFVYVYLELPHQD